MAKQQQQSKTPKEAEVKFRSGASMRSAGTLDGGFYYEFDKHDRCVYHKDVFGYWNFSFFPDEEYITTPHTVIHKYYFLYHPQ